MKTRIIKYLITMNRYHYLFTSFFILFFVSMTFAQYPEQGIGARLGDPYGLTYKKYMGEKALEINFGKTYFWNDDKYYDNIQSKVFSNSNEFEYNYNYYVWTRNKNKALSLQVHYLIHKDLVEGIYWYYGIGGQARFTSYDVVYQYKVKGGPNNWISASERITDMDVGVDGVIGLEYTFEDLPFSIFLEIDLFIELFDDLFESYSQGGIGVRYNF